ncbi:MAG: hypothetical protein EOM20_13430 [Spartobacteria bacterium]|nr:hypothetical protein [Spartobacteria bacterium]
MTIPAGLTTLARVAVLSDWTAGRDALRRALRTLVIEDNDPPGRLDDACARVAVLSDWTAGGDALRRALRTLVIEDNDPPGGLETTLAREGRCPQRLDGGSGCLATRHADAGH